MNHPDVHRKLVIIAGQRRRRFHSIHQSHDGIDPLGMGTARMGRFPVGSETVTRPPFPRGHQMISSSHHGSTFVHQHRRRPLGATLRCSDAKVGTQYLLRCIEAMSQFVSSNTVGASRCSAPRIIQINTVPPLMSTVPGP